MDAVLGERRNAQQHGQSSTQDPVRGGHPDSREVQTG